YEIPSRSAMAATSFAVWLPSHGCRTVLPCTARKAARSSRPICEGPSSPIETPACEPESAIVARLTAAIRTKSYARVSNAAKLERARGEAMGAPGRRLRDLERDVTLAAELGDGLRRVFERLSVEPVLVLDRGDAFPLDRAGDDHSRPARGRERPGKRPVDRLDVVPVDLDCAPAERPRPIGVDVEVPADHRLAALPEPVDVEYRREIV